MSFEDVMWSLLVGGALGLCIGLIILSLRK